MNGGSTTSTRTGTSSTSTQTADIPIDYPSGPDDMGFPTEGGFLDFLGDLWDDIWGAATEGE